MRRIGLTVLALCLLISGCRAPAPIGGDDGGGSGADARADAAVRDSYVPPDGYEPVVDDKVYAHSAQTLYEVDPNDLTVTTVGNFGWPGGSIGEQMTDIALDEDGNMIGISFYRVYRVDKYTAQCTYLADLQDTFNGLSFVEGVGIDPGPALVGATLSGGWYEIDPDTGASTLIGNYGGGMGSSGDIVFVRGAGAFATVTHPSYSTDVLVEVMPNSGQAVVIGETGFNEIWGVAYWAGQVFGFTNAGQFILIDVTTGQGTLVESSTASFWGAGVTTVAPVVR